MKTNEEKKRWLRRYREAAMMEEEIALELEELETKYMIKAVDPSRVGGGSGQKDLSEFAARYDELYRRVLRALEDRAKIRIEIRETVEAMKNETEKLILLYRYINGLGWKEIAQRTHYTERRVAQIHGDALRNIRIPG